jgi:uncharacterized repeat protein (TIGR01451 family)
MQRLVSLIVLISIIGGLIASTPLPLAYAETSSSYQIQLVSMSSEGEKGNWASSRPSISADGRYIAFQSGADNLVPDDTNDTWDVFVHDMATGITTMASVSSSGIHGDISSWNPDISGDGRYVAFESCSANLVEGAADHSSHIYVHDMVNGTTTIASVSTNGTLADDGCALPSISYDGRYIALQSFANNLVEGTRPPEDTRRWENIFVRDMVTGITYLASVSSDGQVADYTCWCPSMSADGRYIAFASSASNLVPEGHNTHKPQIYVRDTVSCNTTIVSTGISGAVADQFSEHPSISGDGRYVAFRSHASNLVEDDTNGVPDIFVRDMVTGSTARVSISCDGTQANGESLDPSISGDGRYVVFTSLANNLAPGDTDSSYDIYRHDCQTGETSLLSNNYLGQELSVTAGYADINGDGTSVVFESSGPSMVPEDTDRFLDVFLVSFNIQPPTWPEGSTLAASNIGQTMITLAWTAAQDTNQVWGYRVFKDSEQLADVSGSLTSYLVDGLTPDTEYTFKVEAIDGPGGIVTTTGPSLTIRTLPEGGQIQLTVVAQPGGLANLAWDPIGPGSEATVYRIYRATEGGPESLRGSVSVNATTSFQDTDLAAETTYTYTIKTVNISEVESHYAGPTEVTTPALQSIASLTWQLRRAANGLVDMGSMVTIQVQGEANRQIEATVGYKTWLDDQGQLLTVPRPVQSAVSLSQITGSPGSYQGGFLIENGISELDSLGATLSDGAGHQVLANMTIPSPIYISGAIRAAVTAALGSLSESRLIAWSNSAGSGFTTAMSDGGSYLLTGLPPSTDYRVRILRSDGRLQASQEGITVANGLETAVSLSPALPASLHLHVETYSGLGIPNAIVFFNDATTGNFIESKVADSQGWLTALQRSLSGDQFRATVRTALPYVSGVAASFTLAAGQNEGTIQVDKLAEGELSGRVSGPEDENIGGAYVTATQFVDGRSATRRTVTDAGGLYNLTLFAGEATVEAASPVPSHSTGTANVNITANSTTNQDFTLDSLGPGAIYAVINTHFLGQSMQTTEMDWATAQKYKLEVNGIEVTGSGYPVPIRGKPGDTVEVTVDGSWANLPKAKQTVTLDSERNGTAAFTLVESGTRIKGQVKYESGDLASGWFAYIYRADASGNWNSVVLPGWGQGLTENLEMGIREPGRYRISVEVPYPWPEIYLSRGYIPPRVDLEVDVNGQDQIIDIGDIVLPVNRFTGTTGTIGSGTNMVWTDPGPTPSSFVALRDRVSSGSQITFRATFRNNGGLTANNAVMLLDIPRDSTLMAGSVIVNNQPVTATVNGNTLEVPLGTVAPWGSGTVYYQIRLPRDMGAQTLSIGGRIRWRAEASQIDLEESLGHAKVGVLGVTLDAPGVLTTLTTRLSGKAPAVGNRVKVYDGPVLLGESPVSEGGLWILDVELPFTGSPQWHTLRAEIDTPAYGRLYSQKTDVLYDVTAVILQQCTIFRTDSAGTQVVYRVTIDASQGVARFPYTSWPEEHMNFELCFTNPQLITGVEVFLGGDGGGKADAALGEDGIYRASIRIGGQLGGTISVSYRTRPDPEIFHHPALTEQEVRLQMPWPSSTFEISTVVERPQENSGSVSFNIQDLDFSIDLSITPESSYIPTVEEIAEAEATGIPVYGFSSNYTILSDPNRIEIEISGYIPEEAVAARESVQALNYVIAKSSPVMASGIALSAPASGGLLKVVASVKIVAQGGLEMADWILSLKHALGTGKTFRELNELLDLIDEKCTECTSCAAFFRGKVEDLALRLMIEKGISSALDLAGVFLAPETLGGTLALVGISQAVDMVMHHNMEKEIKRLHGLIEETCHDEEEGEAAPEQEEEEGDIVIAEPVWVYDPSGYVYEVYADNRLEGVTARLVQQDANTGNWFPWDAEWFGQENPLITDAEGQYAWDVPEGNWMVVYEKAGYAVAYSDALPVPPPQLEVNVGLVSLRSPEVSMVTPTAGGGSVDISFDSYMQASTLTGSTVSIAPCGITADAVSGSLTPVSPVTYNSLPVSQNYRFTPLTAFTVGSSYVIHVSQLAQSYAGIPMAADYETTFTVAAAPPCNGAPLCQDDNATTTENTPVTINVLANDTDPDGDTLIVTGVTDPEHGTASINVDYTIHYVPDQDWYGGPDSFAYFVSDGNGGTCYANVYVTVTPVDESSPRQDIEDLVHEVMALDLGRGITNSLIRNSLIRKLKAAIRCLDRGWTNAAANQLRAFIYQVNALKGTKLSYAQADNLIGKAQSIVDRLSQKGKVRNPWRRAGIR